jgi:cytochrome c oxidase subunit 2
MEKKDGKLLPVSAYLKVWGFVVLLVTLSYIIFLLQIEPLWLRRFLFTAIALTQAILSVTYFMQMRLERSSLVYAVILPVTLVLLLVIFAVGEGGYVHGVRYAFFGSQTAIESREKAPPQNEKPAIETGDPVERGKELAQQNGCLACHTINGSPGVGPTWKGLYGSEVTFTDGKVLKVDEAYLHQCITDPNSIQLQGFPPNVMPAVYGKLLSAQQINDLVAYIKSLGGEGQPPNEENH